MPAGFQQIGFQNSGFQVDLVESVAVTGGKGDNEAAKRRKLHIVKPTGLIDRPLNRPKIEERIEETRAIHREVLEEANTEAPVPEFHLPRFKPIVLMTPSEVDREIAALTQLALRRKEEEENALLFLLIVSA